jgi:bis(5'-nucleosyl)-tetraphosphatase (symmetrical)
MDPTLAEYAIGDLQGCYDPFRRLLDKIQFDPENDRLWLTGDLVSRGPRSRKTLRFVKSLGDAAITVLGNHDLHLIAVANDVLKAGPFHVSLAKILNNDDCAELVDWLRQRPLAHYSESLNTLMVHAGLPPQWSVADTLAFAAEVEGRLRGDRYMGFLKKMYGNQPDTWSDDLTGSKRRRFIVNALTRTRMLRGNALDFTHTGPPDTAAEGLNPWFAAANARWRGTRIVFGHWSALGLIVNEEIISIDTGCVWGRQMSAVRLDQGPSVAQVRCRKKGRVQPAISE